MSSSEAVSTAPTGARLSRSLGWLPAATVLAAGIELLVLRVLTRTAIHIPGLTDLRFVYVPISETGRYAYYVAVVLVILTLVLMAADLLRGRAVAARAAGAGIALFLLVAALARAGTADALTLDAAALGAALLIAPWVLGERRGRSRFAAALLVAAFALPAAGAVQEQAAGSGAVGHDTWLAFAGELLAVGAAIAMPLLVRRPRGRTALVWGTAVGVAVYAGLLINASTTEILMLWNFGLAGYLPSALYAVAAGAATYAIVASWATGHRTTAAAIALMLMGGVGLHSTYQTALVLAGFAVFGAADQLDRAVDAGRSPLRVGAPRPAGPLVEGS